MFFIFNLLISLLCLTNPINSMEQEKKDIISKYQYVDLYFSDKKSYTITQEQLAVIRTHCTLIERMLEDTSEQDLADIIIPLTSAEWCVFDAFCGFDTIADNPLQGKLYYLKDLVPLYIIADKLEAQYACDQIKLLITSFFTTNEVWSILKDEKTFQLFFDAIPETLQQELLESLNPYLNMLCADIVKPSITSTDLTQLLDQGSWTGSAQKISYNPQGTYVVVATSNGYLFLFDTLTNTCLDKKDIGSESTTHVSWHPEGEIFVTIASQETDTAFLSRARMWTIKDNKIEGGGIISKLPGIRLAACDPDYKYIALATDKNVIVLNISDNFKECKKFDVKNEKVQSISDLKWSDEKTELIIGITYYEKDNYIPEYSTLVSLKEEESNKFTEQLFNKEKYLGQLATIISCKEQKPILVTFEGNLYVGTHKYQLSKTFHTLPTCKMTNDIDLVLITSHSAEITINHITLYDKPAVIKTLSFTVPKQNITNISSSVLTNAISYISDRYATINFTAPKIHTLAHALIAAGLYNDPIRLYNLCEQFPLFQELYDTLVAEYNPFKHISKQ